MKNHAIRTPKQASMGRMYAILRSPRQTEKTAIMAEHNYVTFNVATDATKHEISQAVSTIFNVKVKHVRTVNVKGKQKSFRGRRGCLKDFKKAYVRLEDGQNIDLTMGAAS